MIGSWGFIIIHPLMSSQLTVEEVTVSLSLSTSLFLVVVEQLLFTRLFHHTASVLEPTDHGLNP